MARSKRPFYVIVRSVGDNYYVMDKKGNLMFGDQVVKELGYVSREEADKELYDNWS